MWVLRPIGPGAGPTVEGVDGGARWKPPPDSPTSLPRSGRLLSTAGRSSLPLHALVCLCVCAFGREHNAVSVSATWSVRDKSHLPVQSCRVQTEHSHSPPVKSKTNNCLHVSPANTDKHTVFLYLAARFNLSKSCFKVVNILVSQQAETSPAGVDRKVNKAGIVPPCHLSVATMSNSFPLKRALIDSNFTF